VREHVLFRLDDELRRLIRRPANTPFFTQVALR
jgi:hypothetical protein